MPSYIVQLTSQSEGALQVNNRDTMIVQAPDAAAARDAAKSWREDDPNSKWTVADVTEIVAGQPADFAFKVVLTPAGGSPEEFEVPAGEATLEALADAMELLLEASATVGANVAVAAGPPVVLTIASAANLGDADIQAELLLNGEAITGHVASITAPGAAALDRDITLINDSTSDLAALAAALTAGKF